MKALRIPPLHGGNILLDAERLWLFARCVQECLDQPVLHEVAARLAP